MLMIINVNKEIKKKYKKIYKNRLLNILRCGIINADKR